MKLMGDIHVTVINPCPAQCSYYFKLTKVITFYDYFSNKKYDLFMTSAIFLCRGLMFSNDVTH